MKWVDKLIELAAMLLERALNKPPRPPKVKPHQVPRTPGGDA